MHRYFYRLNELKLPLPGYIADMIDNKANKGAESFPEKKKN